MGKHREPDFRALGLVTLGNVRRIARVLGVIGGIGAVLWAMRERFISVAISREPVPPALRVPNDDQPGPSVPSGSITDVSGIGPVYATRLGEVGINVPAELAKADAQKVAEAAQVSSARAEEWIASARSLTESD